MPWKCQAIKRIRQGPWEKSPTGGRVKRMYYTLADGREVTFKDLPVGSMWHSSIEPHSFGSPSICVVLPSKTIWRMNHPGTNGHMWQVSGEIPNVTAHPSINFVGIYHGWVQNGVVSDDCEGRRFSQDGYLVK